MLDTSDQGQRAPLTYPDVITEHSILLHHSNILAKDSRCMHWIMWKLLHPNTMNRKDGSEEYLLLGCDAV
jgi:hypothetical protein